MEKNSDMQNVTFKGMTEHVFLEQCEKLMASYAEDMTQAGLAAKEDALKLAQNTFTALLPKGFHTPGVDFYAVFNSENEEIGNVFLMERQPGVALIMWIEIKEQFRRRGYGRSVLARIENELAAKNYGMIVLNVFEFNKGAKGLYESCGYTVFNVENGAIAMKKSLKDK